MSRKKWKGTKRYQTKEWRRGFGVNPKTGEHYRPFMTALKNMKKDPNKIIVRRWMNR